MIAVLMIAAVALHVEEMRDVSTASVSLVLERLAAGIEARTGARVALDASQWVDCRGKARSLCVEELRDDEVIMLVLIGGITKLRVLAQRFSASGSSLEQSIDLPKGSEAWPPILATLIASLYPESNISTNPPLSPPPLPELRNSLHIPSWIALGVAVAATSAALILQAESAAVQDELTTGLRTPAALEALLNERRTTQRAADILFIGACTSATAALVFALFDL